MESRIPPYKAYLLPFGAFLLLFALGAAQDEIASRFYGVSAPLSQYWVYPVQALICGALIINYWRTYSFGKVRNWGFTLAIALLVLGIWIAPQELLHYPRRMEGFDPTRFAQNPLLFGLVLGLRFLRLVVVVPLMEEIFWRGFLLRDMIDQEDFTRIPFGTFTFKSCCIVAAAFAIAHWGPDFPAALVTGFLYNAVAYRTRSLASCVLAHAVTNLLLGGYILQTKQWGFW